MSALLELAERCEAATAEEEAELIEEAWRLLHPSTRTKGPQWSAAFDVLEKRLACDAFVDAALTLVPEGFDWIIGRTNDGMTIHAEVGGRGDEYQRFAATPALAISAAALRAKASEQNNG